MESMQLRAFAAGDFDAWYRLWRDYQAFYRSDIPEDVSRTTWQRLLDVAEPMRGTFAVAGGSVLGFVHTIEHRSCWTRGNSVYLQDLFVSAEARGRGLGRALIEHVYVDAVSRGNARVHWLTHESNREAMLLYDRVAERSGFVQYKKVFPT